jgi:hypothetical protein
VGRGAGSRRARGYEGGVGVRTGSGGNAVCGRCGGKRGGEGCRRRSAVCGGYVWRKEGGGERRRMRGRGEGGSYACGNAGEAGGGEGRGKE